jgi:6-phosphogluconolactonase
MQEIKKLRQKNQSKQLEPIVLITEDQNALIHRAAEVFTQEVRELSKTQDRISVVLSGGSTPKALHLILSDQGKPYFSQIPWKKIHFFWGDERFVPEDDPESNFRMARETLLDRVPIEEDQIHRIITEDLNPEESAQAYQRELQMFFRQNDLKSPPRFDFIFLGMGPDGHTASLFPDTPLGELESGPYSECWVKSFYVPHLSRMRISFTPHLINRAKKVVFLVGGKEKAQAFDKVMNSDESPHKFPAKLISPSGGDLLWIVDEDVITKKREVA